MVEAVAGRIARRVVSTLADDCGVALDRAAVARVHGAVVHELAGAVATPQETRAMVRQAFRAGLAPDD